MTREALEWGADVVLASPAGGAPPLDPASDSADAQTAATERFKRVSTSPTTAPARRINANS